MVWKAAIGLALAASPAAAAPQDLGDGNGLYATCTATGDAIAFGACLGFIRGVIARDQLDFWMKSPTAYTCDLSGVTNAQIMDVVKNSLRDHPETRHYDSAGLVARAVQLAFCKK